MYSLVFILCDLIKPIMIVIVIVTVIVIVIVIVIAIVKLIARSCNFIFFATAFIRFI